MIYQYIKDDDALGKAIIRLRNSPILGVDTEAAGYHRYHDRISLIQISSREENVIIDPIAVPNLGPLRPIMADVSIEKIFHDADFDLRILHRDLAIEVRSLFDTQIAAAFVGERSLGLGAVVEKFLGITLPKAYQRADWAERPLTAGMLEYAATDTAYLAPVRDRLMEELQRLGRLHWAQEEFLRRESTRWDPQDGPSDAFLRIKGARDLSRRGLAILREVWGWREAVGEERDQATFRVLSNQAMIELSLKAPTTMADLRAVQGLSDGMVDRRGNDLLAAVKRGLAVPEGDLPRFPAAKRWDRDPAVEARAERLRQLRQRRAEELDLDPGFLISRSVLDEVARKNPGSIDEMKNLPDLRGWQIEAMGDAVLRALRA